MNNNNKNNNNNNNIVRLKTYTDNLKIIISLNDKLLQSIFQPNSINNKLTHLEEQLEFSNELIQKNKTFLNNFLKKNLTKNVSKKYNNIDNRLNKNSIDIFKLHLNILNIQIEKMTKIQHFFENIKNIQNKTTELLNKKQNINQLIKKKKKLENILKKK